MVVATVAPHALAGSPDGIDLTVSRGPGAGDVSLGWTGTIPTYTVFRSTDPALSTFPANGLGETAANSYVDTPPAGDLFFYAVVGTCPGAEINCGGFCDLDTDADTVCDVSDNCPTVANTDQTDQDGDLTGDVCDYCISDPAKIEQGLCGCSLTENTADDDGDGVINCRDQCPGSDDSLDADAGGLPDACDPCPSGLCGITLPDRFYAELPDHRVLHVSRDGRWIAAVETDTNRGILISTEAFIANPSDPGAFEEMGDAVVLAVRGFSDDGNFVAANIYTHVPGTAYLVVAGAIYDRTHGSWRVLGLYDDAVNINACRFYPNTGDMSSDGRYLYGRTATVEKPCRYTGFRYDVETDAWELFAGPEGDVRLVEAASGNGDRIAGSENMDPVYDEFGNQIGGGFESPVEWTVTDPGVFTPQWVGPSGVAYDVTFDGSATAVSADGLACRWTPGGGLEQLGPGTLDVDWMAEARAISDGGNIIAGYHVFQLSTGLPFIWVENVGFGNLLNYLEFRGHTDLGTFDTTFRVQDLSGDGRVIVGDSGRNLTGTPGWVVVTMHD